MDLYYRTLTWPAICLLITGGVHFAVEAIWPDLRTSFSASVLAPILLAYGVWVGRSAVRLGGSLIHAIVAALLLGVLPTVLDIVGFGQLLGRGIQAGVLSAVFAVAVILFGSLVGAGYTWAERDVARG